MHPNLVDSQARSHMDALLKEALAEQLGAHTQKSRPWQKTLVAQCGRLLIRGGTRLVVSAQVEPA